jgi:hypothetical protein
MAQPGPAQVFPSNISRVNFPLGGDLLFVRIENGKSGSGPGGTPSSMVTRLPGDLQDFEAFGTITPQKDPKNTSNRPPPVVHPVSSAMLGYYALWPRLPVYTATTSSTETPEPTVVIDIAEWDGMLHTGIRVFTSSKMSKEDAFEYSYNAFNDNYGPYPRENFSVVLTLVFDVTPTFSHPFGRFREVKPYPDPEWATTFAFNGWSWHLEPGKPTTSFSTVHISTFILNLAVLRKNQPEDPVTKQKEPTHTIRIYAPVGEGSNWGISAAATRARRSFPLDVSDQTGQLLWPTWEPYPFPNDAKVGGGVHGLVLGGFVDMVITFGTKDVPPKVEFINNLNVGSPS